MTDSANSCEDVYRICASDPRDASKLSALAVRSKAYWGYDDAFMQRCHRELSWSAEQISARHFDFQSCYRHGELLAFYAFNYVDDQTAELEALFVEPQYIGSGIGRRMIEHAKSMARSRRVTRIIIQGDPHAERFYLAIGAVRCGSRESGSISGRLLPLFEIRLDQLPGETEDKNDGN